MDKNPRPLKFLNIQEAQNCKIRLKPDQVQFIREPPKTKQMNRRELPQLNLSLDMRDHSNMSWKNYDFRKSEISTKMTFHTSKNSKVGPKTQTRGNSIELPDTFEPMSTTVFRKFKNISELRKNRPPNSVEQSPIKFSRIKKYNDRQYKSIEVNRDQFVPEIKQPKTVNTNTRAPSSNFSDFVYPFSISSPLSRQRLTKK